MSNYVIDPIHLTQLAMNEDELRLTNASNNVSNLQTPAFNKQFIDFIEPNDSKIPDANQLAMHFLSKKDLPLTETHRTTDFATSENAYVKVLYEGQIAYTKRLNCYIDSNGTLKTASGATVLNESDSPVIIPTGEFQLQTNGDIYQNNEKLTSIPLYQFDTSSQFNALMGGLLQPNIPALRTHDATIKQGFIQQSNVTHADEMSAMLTTLRHMQQESRLLKTLHNTLLQAVNILGETNV